MSKQVLLGAVIGSVMARFRIFATMTQAQCAESLGLTQGQLSHYESGRSPPGSIQLYRWERLFIGNEALSISLSSGFVMEVVGRVASTLETRDVQFVVTRKEVKSPYPEQRLQMVVDTVLDGWLCARGSE